MKRRTAWNVSRTACATVCLAGSFAFVEPSQAAEYGWGTYLLGISIPMMGFTPPPGFYLSDTVYAYQGSASAGRGLTFPFGNFTLSGRIKEDFLVNISTISWITDTKILGGNLGFAATIPFPIGTERTSASAAVTGPLGNTVSGSLTESAWGIGDTAVAALLGWQQGNSHWNVVVTGTIPTGVYDPDRIAFLGLHRLPSTSGEPIPTSTPKRGSRSRVRSASRSTTSTPRRITRPGMSSISSGMSMSILRRAGPPGSADMSTIR